MKITDIKTFSVDCFRTNWVFVKVYTDEGVTGVGEATPHIENLLFNNIVMDKTAGSPIKMIIHKSEDVICDAVKNIRFTGIHVNGPKMPLIHGRPSCHIQNIYFDDCSFTVTDGREFDNLTNHGSNMHGDTYHMFLECVDNIRFNNTDFSVEG